MKPEKIRRACSRAIELAEKSKTSFERDNSIHPAVGVVILDREGVVLSEAYRNEDAPGKRAGSHAEVVALNKLGRHDLSKADTLVTTLEPCSLRRSVDMIPCSRRVVRVGIRRVFIGCLDPGVGVRGHGAQLLQDRGVYFTMFPEALSDLVRRYNDQYLRHYRQWTVKPDLLPPFDLEKAPRESLTFLRGSEFQDFVANLFHQYKVDFGTKFIAWPDYFATHAVASRPLEDRRIRSKERTVFEQLASYLAISPHDPAGQQETYQRVGEWWSNHKKQG
jgi:pyrimidine deaminase RibD-like protein